MTAIETTVKEKGIQNWVKDALALKITKQGLDDFIRHESIQFQKSLLHKGINCTQCSTEDVLDGLPNYGRGSMRGGRLKYANKTPNKPCPNNICHDVRDGIHNNHRLKAPSWNNTDAKAWCLDSFEVDKCYLPSQGYFHVKTLAETDFNGVLYIIYNNRHFQNKFSSTFHQLCEEAIKIGRRVRHSPTLDISDQELTEDIDTLVCLLSDPKHLAGDENAQKAVDKLNQLKAQTLNITTEDVLAIVEDKLNLILTEQKDKVLGAIAQSKDSALEAIAIDKEAVSEAIAHDKDSALEAIAKKNTEVQKNILGSLKDDLQRIQTTLCNTSIKNLDQMISKRLTEFQQAVEGFVEQGKEQIQDELLKKIQQREVGVENAMDVDLETYFKEDLIEYYRKFQSTLPISPIVDDQDVLLNEFYVKTPLNAVDLKRKFSNDSSGNTTLQSYAELFSRTDGSHFKDIYITGKAGVGKTSFVKRMCMIWCQAHQPLDQVGTPFEADDVNAMKEFEFLFMITLRDTDPNLCRIDDMIYQQLVQNLSRSRRYNEHFLETILHDKKCLIILDGLDEWPHPEHCPLGSRNVHDLPHRPARKGCTILTTTRLWKLNVLGLGTNMIDRQIELKEMDRASSTELISNAIGLLNEHTAHEDNPKTSDEFENILTSSGLDSVRCIPYILLQSICVWFDGETIGNSKCEVYSNILELTLIRCFKKKDMESLVSTNVQIDNFVEDIPDCFTNKQLLTEWYGLLLQLGKVAFEALVNSNKESSLVFDASVVSTKLSKSSVEFCLETGLLCQNKDQKKFSSRRRTFSFQHKSVQEYMAALYIQSSIDNEETKQKLLQTCNTLAGVLEMSNTLTFIGGFNPKACKEIFEILRDVVSNDVNVQYYRRNLMAKEIALSQSWRIRESIRGFLTLEEDILEEMENSSQELIPLHIEDIAVDKARNPDSNGFLKILVDNNKAHIKSFDIRDFQSSEELTAFLDDTKLRELCMLEKLTIVAVPSRRDLEHLLSQSSNTLKCLRLSFFLFDEEDEMYMKEKTFLSTNVIRNVSQMRHLSALMINNIKLSHESTCTLFDAISNQLTMTELALYNISCKDDKHYCSGVILDLSNHRYLRTLNLDKTPVADLRLNTFSLEECLIGEGRQSMCQSLFDKLVNSSKLRSLWFRSMSEDLMENISVHLSELTQLNKFGIELTCLGDTALALSADMGVSSVYFYRVAMTSERLRQFVESLVSLAHPVRMTLEDCRIIPKEKYVELKQHLTNSQQYKVHFDKLNFRDLPQFEFETVMDKRVVTLYKTEK